MVEKEIATIENFSEDFEDEYDDIEDEDEDDEYDDIEDIGEEKFEKRVKEHARFMEEHARFMEEHSRSCFRCILLRKECLKKMEEITNDEK